MPAVTRVVFYDDKTWPELAGADEIVRVTITRQPVAGGEAVKRTVELYLTGAHAAELDKDLDGWFGIGHKSGAPASGSRQSKNMRFGPQDAAKGSQERRDWWQGMRDWADSLNLRNPRDSSRRAWQTTTGKDYPPVDLAEGYTLHLQGLETEASAKVARFRPDAQRKAG